MKNDNLLIRFGTIPDESGFKSRMRIHQGWWRMNVLAEPPGKHPKQQDSNVCNTILNGQESKNNFLTENAFKAVEQTLTARNGSGAGMMQEDRLFNNLLSSQPLCFNFFGELMADKALGLSLLQSWWSDLTELEAVFFEFAPEERFTDDNSAFDVAFEVRAGSKKGLIGLECKYTDTFSSTVYDKAAYREIFEKSDAFTAQYDDLKSSRFNQIFRNQLIAEASVQNGKFDFVRTGLFCHQDDKNAIQTALTFQEMVTEPANFKIITYDHFIASVQRLDLDWNQREWSMLLWARYCAAMLSQPTLHQIEKYL